MPTRVLVFPCSNEPGLEVIEALRRHPRIEVFGASGLPAPIDPSVSLLGAERRFELPFIDDPTFDHALSELCTRLGIDRIFPTLDAAVGPLAAREEPPIVGADAETATVCLSKSAVYRSVGRVVPIPRPFTSGDSLPAFAKPDRGSGSRGAIRLDSLDALRAAQSESSLLVQEYLPGREFTVDCLGGADGRLIACSPRERVAVTAGIARAATCVVEPVLIAHCEAIQTQLRVVGPWFAQFREDRDGTARLMEVNCRIAGSSGLSRLAGVNIPLMAVLESIGVSVVQPRRLDGITLLRTLDRRGRVDDFDVAIWDLDDTLLHAGDRVDPEAVAALFRLDQRGKSQFLVSKNPDPAAAIARAKIPDFFVEIVRTDDKLSTVSELAERHRFALDRTLMINDSGAERALFERALPSVRTIAPDALPVLG